MTEKYHQVSSQEGRIVPNFEFKKCIQVCPGNRTTVIWHLKDWSAEEGFLLLAKNATCFVNIVDDNTKEGMRWGADSGVGLRFCFNFWKEVRDSTYLTQYLSLNCEQVNITKKHGILGYDFQVKFIDDKLNVIKEEYAVDKEILLTDEDDDDESTTNAVASQIVLEKRFVTIAYCESNIFGGGKTTNLSPRPADLRLKISVTPILLSTVVKTADESNSEDALSILQALKNMFVSDENYADINLSTRDNVTLKAHKFILAARSPKLRDLMEIQLKEKDSNGTLKLQNVTGDAMKVILHWMYSGELHENAGNCMSKVLEAAIHFRLGKLIQLLEWKLEMGCTKENMFEFYKVAQAHGMKTVADEISQFIKRNIPKEGHSTED